MGGGGNAPKRETNRLDLIRFGRKLIYLETSKRLLLFFGQTDLYNLCSILYLFY